MLLIRFVHVIRENLIVLGTTVSIFPIVSGENRSRFLILQRHKRKVRPKRREATDDWKLHDRFDLLW